ncbi:hypothetical protein VE03_02945 [Pseudogymnoascus sp. 23342-1-I1]|nr:hypothetical protein VE03_02945 [Pseudogymnoascus sp. 23342-1-I1]
MGVSTRKFIPEQDSELFDPETGNCSIEYFNACKDPYRVSGDKTPPVSWPWFSYKSSEAGNLLSDQLSESIRDVLVRHKIRPGMIGNYKFAPRHTPHDAKETMFIRTQDDFDVSWQKAASEIYYGIVEPAATAAGIQMGVEIQNYEKMYSDASYFIEDDATIHSISRIQPYVLGAVMEHCPAKWTSIAYHHRERQRYEGETRVTAIIYVKPGKTHAWGELEEKIVSAIQSATFPEEIDIAVEILPGRISLSQQSPQDPTLRSPEGPLEYHSLSCLPLIPSIGSSIAPSDCTDAAGSLGPVVSYRAAGTEEFKKCFLTCYNVIATGDLAGKQTNDILGIGLRGRQVDYQIDIEYPAKYDAINTREFHKSITDGGRESGREQSIERLDVIAARGPLGQVRFASGYRLTDTNHRMDWALVELVDPTLLVQNLIPAEEGSREKNFRGVYMMDPIKKGDTVQVTSNCLDSTWYGKVGRTSRCTGGVQGRIKRAIRWDDGTVSHEYEFRTKHSYDRFALLGDAGSLVLNVKKEWAGMIFAVEKTSGIGFVTPAFELLRDIEETTGGTITLA